MYFPTPTQVKYYDADGDRYIGGIGWRHYIICGCCGQLIDIDDVLEFTPADKSAIIIAEYWEDISYELGGDEIE